ncbi:tRNA-splicing ligase RtcB [Catalinimonas alkaloidigena]|uniref:3'-phosphate/5'-hydroxy nucleic acid ligase n=1 Tax=Catalinimonas alkaloidigena TaxID=1075417 RepID=A0A1G9T998_9BACT|nr:RtcB family protein [Catalinimonas alkaloidigena]SDM44257.1 tRNA-splicing ligase RtcB [Catalinimonas alkaloidigena]
MASNQITGKELRQLGYPEGPAIGHAMRALEGGFRGKSKTFKLDLLTRVLREPALYRDHDHLGPVAEALIGKQERQAHALHTQRIPYAIYGAEGIEPGAVNQMEIAMKLPVTRAGALMPDAHQGYGLPIGGVLATENAVIPYGVGVDIGCRMCLSVFDLPISGLQHDRARFQKLLNDHTRFGQQVFQKPLDDAVLERPEFQDIRVVRELKDRAWRQIGSSGGGNHFAEFGVVDILEADNGLGLAPGQYLAVLSHSGSRGLGAEIARHYTHVAKTQCQLPDEARHLAWLDLDGEAGQEYWRAMNLAGDYASANHHHIHRRLAQALGAQPLAMVENHHNFAWKETGADGREYIVHRKGATPAGAGVLGIIPGSMTAPGFIVRGKGDATSLNSASHGAGRVMSRRKAKDTLNKHAVRQHLHNHDVTVIGSGLDEAPMAYKDIRKVMAAQSELVDVLGTFTPRIVRMAGPTDGFDEVTD